MRGTVYVMPPEDFDAWLRSNQPDRSMAAQGKQLFMEYGCSGCHVQGLHPAPRLEGLFGRLVTLQNGSAVPADEQYIRDSILLPQKHIVAGYTPVMPSFQGQITEGEIFEIIEYIKSISDDEKGNP
jgi:cytochrome c oxidase subunit 2